MRCSRSKAIAIVASLAVLAGGVYWWNRHKIPHEAARALETAEQYELYSLLPKPEAEKPQREFHSYTVLGSVSIAAPAVRQRLTDALKIGSRSGYPKSCFEPRHGIGVRRGDEVTDFVICFECNYVRIMKERQFVGGFVVDSSPQPVFDEVLKGAGIALAPSALEGKK
jgi:hypothetical protein